MLAMHDGSEYEGVFIGVGVDHYTRNDLPNLVGSADEVEVIAGLVGDHFVADVLRDAAEQAIGGVPGAV